MVRMVIKSSLSTREKAENSGRILFILFICGLLAGCAGLKTRDQVPVAGEQRGAEGTVAPPPPVSAQHSQEPPPTSAPPVAVTPPAAPTPLPAPPTETFLKKEPLKVGVILGPGGMRAFAHVGVLKEMARARLPIKAIVGLEWGAVIGGLFATQGQANDVEWKAFKLRENDIPGSGLLSKGIKPQRPTELSDFLTMAFSRQTIEQGRIEFACPSYNVRTERFGWYSKGSFKDILPRCVAYPPYYVDIDGWLAAPFAVEEAASYLRSRGANLIVYVNALAGGEIFPIDLVSEQYADYVLWSEARRQAAKGKLPGVNVILNVNTADHGYVDYADRRQIMDAGVRAAHDLVNKLVTQYGF